MAVYHAFCSCKADLLLNIQYSDNLTKFLLVSSADILHCLCGDQVMRFQCLFVSKKTPNNAALVNF